MPILDIEKMKSEYEKQLQHDFDIISTLELDFTQMELNDAFDYKSLPTDKFVLYFIELPDCHLGNTIHDCIRNKEQGVCKTPKSNTQNQDSKYLYVGKCCKNFRGRMKQYLTKRYPSTYGIHLREWWDGPLENWMLNYCVVPFPQGIDVEDRGRILLLIETILHSNLRPLLGKSGDNNMNS